MGRNFVRISKAINILLTTSISGLLILWSLFFVGSTRSELRSSSSCVEFQAYFPVLFNDYYALLTESEENDIKASADGPLRAQTWYTSNTDDAFDFFRFETVITGDISITVTDHQVGGGQVALYSVTSYPTYLKMSATPPTYNLNYADASPNTYYVLVYIDTTKAYTQEHEYNLIVDYPQPPISNQTPSPIPPCTITPVPSLTSSVTPSVTPKTACEFEAISAGFSVLFPTGTAGHIRADVGEKEAMTTAVSLTPIAPGFYQVTMYSYDNHTAKPHQIQPDETWYLHLKNASGTVIATAGPSTDIPDGAGNDCQPTYLENMLVLTDTAVSAEAYHAAYPDPHKNPNSVNPDYALLIPVRMVAPPPTRTPLPPHLATRTPTP